MWKIHRYYLKEIAINGVLTFVVLFGIALVSLLYKGIRMLQGGDLLDAALTTLLLAADIFPHLLTFSLLFATVLTFARASQEREITAIRALGISPRVPMTAALLIGLICSLVGTWALHYEIPWAHYHKYRVVADIYTDKIKALLRDRDRIELENGTVMTWLSKEEIDGRVVSRGVSIYADPHGSFAKLAKGSMGKVGTLILADEVWFEIEADTNRINMLVKNLYFPVSGLYREKDEFSMNLVDILKGRGSRNAGDKDLRSDSLLSEVYRNVHPDPLAARYMVHRRACFALIPFLLAPIGFCIGVLSRERGRVLALSFCMIPLALVYLVDFFGESAMRQMQIPVLGWLPSIVLVLAGFPSCWRLLRV